MPSHQSFKEFSASQEYVLLRKILTSDEYEAQNLPEEERGVLPFEGKEPNEVKQPDAIGIQVGGDFIVGGGGASQTFQFLFVKDYGFVVIGNTGGGVGLDVSVGAQVVVAWTENDNPTFEDFTGTGFQATGGFSFATATYFVDYEQASKRIGANTEGIAFGLAVGLDDLSTLGSGSTQVVTGYVIDGATYPGVKKNEMKTIIFSLLLAVSILSCVSFGCEGYIDKLHDQAFEGVVTRLDITKQRRYQHVYIDNDDSPVMSVYASMDQEVWLGLEVGYRIKKSSGNSYVSVIDNLGETKRYPLTCK